jgi:CheY-like chemotaxis protein
MDIYMPLTDGIQTTRRMREDPELAHVTVVAHAARAIILADLKALFDGVCEKPCPPERRVKILVEAIAARGAN